jgi:hypothetical protein
VVGHEHGASLQWRVECVVLSVYLVGEGGHADDRDVIASGSEPLHGAMHESVGAALGGDE